MEKSCVLEHYTIIPFRIKSNIYLDSRSPYKDKHCSLSWKPVSLRRSVLLSSQKRSFHSLLGTWDHLGHEYSGKLKVTTSEIVFYNSSRQIPVFKLSVELKFWADSYGPFEMDHPLSAWQNSNSGCLVLSGWRTHV